MPALNSLYGTEPEIRMPQTMSGSYRKWIAMAIGNRMKLMPFIRTLVHEAQQTGAPVVRPLFFEFADSDPNVYQIYDQFLLGDAVLVSPVLDAAVNEYKVYFPQGSWYGLWTGDLVGGGGGFKNIQDIKYQVAAHIKGGTILPIKVSNRELIKNPRAEMSSSKRSLLQKHYGHSNIDTYQTQDNTLIVALGCDASPRGVTSTCEASGTLYLEVPGLDTTDNDKVISMTAVSNTETGYVKARNNLT